MLTAEQLNALRILAGWRRRIYEACDHEAHMLQQDAVRKPWFAPGSDEPHGNIWEEEKTAPKWKHIRADLARALEENETAPLGERGKIRGAVPEVVREGFGDDVFLRYSYRVGGGRVWAIGTDSEHFGADDSENEALLESIDYLAEL